LNSEPTRCSAASLHESGVEFIVAYGMVVVMLAADALSEATVYLTRP
jgi:hypothetical protein